MFLFTQNKAKQTQSRGKQSWLWYLLLTLIALVSLAQTPQVHAAEPSQMEAYLVGSRDASEIYVVPLEEGKMPDLSAKQEIRDFTSCDSALPPELVTLSDGDFLAVWHGRRASCYSRFEQDSNGDFTQTYLEKWPKNWHLSSPNVVADLNGDGLDDLLLSRKKKVERKVFTYKYKVALGESDGTFNFTSEPVVFAYAAWQAYITLGDVDGDGHHDLIRHHVAKADFFTTQLYMQAGQGDGTFAQEPKPLLTAPENVGTTTPVIADLNEDGYNDIFMPPHDYAQDQGQAYLAFNDGEGNFTVKESVDLRAKNEKPSKGKFTAFAFTCDIELDGQLDLITNSFHLRNEKYWLSIHTGDGSGDFKEERIGFDQGRSIRPSLACFSPQKPLPIQEIEKARYVMQNSILIRAEVGFNVPKGFLGYQWNETRRISLESNKKDVILYELSHPASESALPQNVDEYQKIFNALLDLNNNNSGRSLNPLANNQSNSAIECASFNQIVGSPNSQIGGLSDGLHEIVGHDPTKFESQPAFDQNLIGMPNASSSSTGANVIIGVFDAFRHDAATHWASEPSVQFNLIETTLSPIDSGPDAAGDKSTHGEIIVSQILAVTPNAQIVPVRVLNENAVGDTLTLIEGIDKMIANYVQQRKQNPELRFVANFSLGLSVLPGAGCDIDTIDELLELGTTEHDMVFVAAAGNDGRYGSHPSGVSQYPGNSPHVMSVAAYHSAFAASSYSRAGDVIIYGGDVRPVCGSTNPDPDCVTENGIIGQIPVSDGTTLKYEYHGGDGTSFAAPWVTSAAAKMLSCDKSFTTNQVKGFIDSNSGSFNDATSIEEALSRASCP